MIRLGLHVQGAHDAAARYIASVRPQLVKFLDDPPSHLVDLVHSYGGLTLLRVYWEPQGVAEYGEYLKAVERKANGSAVKAVEVSYNEAMQDAGDLAAKAELDIAGMKMAERIGKVAVIGSFSVGMPALEDWGRYRPALEYAAAHGHLLGLHQYGGGSKGMRFDPAWFSLRHRQVIAWARAAGVRLPGIVITESGIDNLDQADMKTRGFQTMPAGYDYATDMAWWCTELSLDAAIVGAVDFGFGAADPQWHPFDLSRQPAVLSRMISLQAALPAAPPPPAPPKPPKEGAMLPIQTLAGRHFSSRAGRRPMWLVLHSAANSAEATTENVARYLGSNGVGASAHYLVGDDAIYQIVVEEKAAHHAGGSTLPDGTRGPVRVGGAFVVDAVNACTIGVEMMQTAGQPVRPAVLAAAIPLLVDICRRNAIPADHIVSHAAISVNAPQGAHSDPVGVDMDLVRARVAAGLGTTAPGQLQWPKVVWCLEEATRILEREGLQAEASYIANTYTAAAKKKRDRSS